MRGADCEQSSMFSYISAERRVPKDHPLRAIRAMADAALAGAKSVLQLSGTSDPIVAEPLPPLPAEAK